MQVKVEDLRVEIDKQQILKGLAFYIGQQDAVGIVGESGSGKSMLVKSLIGLLPYGSKAQGILEIDERPYRFRQSEHIWRKIRGSAIGMVMQDPFTALNPSTRCGTQILAGVPRIDRKNFSIDAALREVGLPIDVKERYPSQLSGGQRQRVVIAAALATKPKLLIADEATTALDVITQEEILDLIFQIRRERNMPIILITHNILLAKKRTNRVYVMDQGLVVETGETAIVLESPQHDKTKELLHANQFLIDAPYASGAIEEKAILCVQQLNKSFDDTKALHDVSIIVDVGECVGIVGQSGSGKTTLGRCIVGLQTPDSGRVNYFGTGNVQMVFQDPYSTLNPAHTIRYILEEALEAAGRDKAELDELIRLTEIDSSLLQRKPAGLSGGQRQRVAIARALAPQPNLIICDESVSALDVKVQNQILRMIERLRLEKKLAILFITHDLAVLRMLASRVYVMHEARIVEHAYTKDIFAEAKDPYTKKLIEASELNYAQ